MFCSRPHSQALCLATATQQPTTSRHRQQVYIAAGRAGPRKARLQKGAAGMVPPRGARRDLRLRLRDYRAGRAAPPVEWRRPVSRLAEALGL
jgi:hypothetical protein